MDLGPRYAVWSLAAGLPSFPSPDLEKGASSGITFPGTKGIQVSITSPQSGLRVIRDPETPTELASLSLQAVVEPPIPQLLWEVDGQPFTLVERPYSARWPLIPGEHVIRARVPYQNTVSAPIRVRVE